MKGGCPFHSSQPFTRSWGAAAGLPNFSDGVMATGTGPGRLERDGRIAALERRVAELEALVRDRSARLGPNATNSGTPPSAAPKPERGEKGSRSPIPTSTG
jgi:hypothetical protein